jgi:hypothetical protein
MGPNRRTHIVHTLGPSYAYSQYYYTPVNLKAKTAMLVGNNSVRKDTSHGFSISTPGLKLLGDRRISLMTP